MELQQYVHRGRAHGFLLPHPSHDALTGTLSLPPSLRPSSSSLSFRPRNVGENPRRLARIFLGLYYYCRGSTQMVSSTGRFVPSAERGFIFLPPLCSPHPFLLSSPLSIFPSSSSSRHDSRTTSDYRIPFSFGTFFLENHNFRQETSSPLSDSNRRQFSPVYTIFLHNVYICIKLSIYSFMMYVRSSTLLYPLHY